MPKPLTEFARPREPERHLYGELRVGRDDGGDAQLVRGQAQKFRSDETNRGCITGQWLKTLECSGLAEDSTMFVIETKHGGGV